LRIERDEFCELDSISCAVWIHPVDRFDLDECIELLATLVIAWFTHSSGDDIALAKAIPTDLLERDVDILWTWEVATGAKECVILEDVEKARYGDQHIVFREDDLALPATVASEAIPAIEASASISTVPTIATVATVASIPAVPTVPAVPAISAISTVASIGAISAVGSIAIAALT
jgi:hypothetical protein